MTFLMRWITAGLLLSASVAPASAWATPVSPVTATAAPTGCRADGQCAGLPLDFHTGGSLRSPGPMWAGRWWFTDAHGMAHQGSCTFNRGVHPAHAVPSHRVRQTLPLDPTGDLTAYLTWRYGTSDDALTAAAMWAVLHHYALDAAGGSRSLNPAAPLVPRLDLLGLMTGRDDLQQRAIALDREARAYAGPWTVTMHLDRTGVVTVEVRGRSHPIPDVPVSVLVSGRDAPLVAATGPDGIIRRRVPLPATPGTVTAVVLVTVPGRAEAYRGTPAMPSPLGSQTLVTAGPPRHLRVSATLVVPPTTTTTATTTTTTVPTTTTTTTTTTAPTTTSAGATTTARPTTTVAHTTTTRLAPTTAAALPPPLPRTGGHPDGGIALLATALLVGGVGVLGTLRRGHLHSDG